MKLKPLLKTFERLVIDNSPQILTVVSVVGVGVTSYLSGRSAVKAYRLTTTTEVMEHKTLSRTEVFKLTWAEYIPPVSTGIITIAAIVSAQHVNTKRATAMAAAYTFTDKAFTEYREKIVGQIGENKEAQYRAEIAQEHITADPHEDSTIVITDNGDVMCYDHFSGRYFKSSMQALQKAEIEINFQILNEGYASVSDLYYILGLPITSFSEEVGWNTNHPLKIHYSTVMSTDNKPCISMDFDLHPRRKYSHLAGT